MTTSACGHLVKVPKYSSVFNSLYSWTEHIKFIVHGFILDRIFQTKEKNAKKKKSIFKGNLKSFGILDVSDG